MQFIAIKIQQHIILNCKVNYYIYIDFKEDMT